MNIAILQQDQEVKELNKNIHKFYNKPFISHTINIIKKTKIFNQIIVSTDSKKFPIFQYKKVQKCPS